MIEKTAVYDNLIKEVYSCDKCGLGGEKLDGFDPHVMGQGSLDARFMFFAEAPGLKETQQNQPLTQKGKSGSVYEKLLVYLGLTREQVFTSNTILCRPPQNRDPEPYEIKMCRPFLETQLKLINPRLIITFGRFAAQVFLSDFKITRDHGKIYHSESFGFDIFPLYHPAYVSVYAPRIKKEEFKQDTKKLKHIIKEI